MLKIVALKDSKGSFKSKDTNQMIEYDNFNIYCVDDEKDNSDVVFGICPDVYKVKKEVVYRLCKPEQVKALENKHVIFYYDAYKKIVRIEVGQ